MFCTRREMLIGGTSMGLACSVAPCDTLSALESPFLLGVASGDPWPDGFVIWTRLVRDPFEPDGGVGASPIEIKWEVARNENMGDIVRTGVSLAMPDVAHSAHVEVRGLDPGRWYWYRFHAGGAASPIGRARTAPASNAALGSLRFVAASCQHWMYGNWAAYRRMVEEEIEFVLHLGDYIYEAPSSNPAAVKQKVREVPFGIPKSVHDYRRIHALYKTDPAIQAAHAAFPWIAIWDDHEVENDYAAGRSQARTALLTFLQQRAAAYQAFWEHMPLRNAQRPNGPDALLYRHFGFGDLIDLFMLDERQYRSPLPCPPPAPRPDRNQYVSLDECPETLAPNRTMLGEDQEEWLARCLSEPARARWVVLGQQLVFAPFLWKLGAKLGIGTDGWDGYATPHQRMLDLIAARRNRHTIVLGGDMHAFIAADVPAQRNDFGSEAIASHLVCGPISSRLADHDRYMASLPENPHVKFVDARRHGYTRCTLARDRALFEFRAVDDVRDPHSAIATLASFETERGKAGIRQL